jgi:hypothetical protein
MCADTQRHPVFPTPAQFGEPLEVGGWKNRKPSWVQVVPQVTNLKYTTMVRNKFYCKQALLTNVSGQVQMFPATRKT